MKQLGTARDIYRQFGYKLAPCFALGIRDVSGIVPRLFYMASAAQRLKVRGLIWIVAALQRNDMIALQTAGPPALPASPIVTLEDAEPEQLPAPTIERREVPGARMLSAHPTAKHGGQISALAPPDGENFRRHFRHRRFFGLRSSFASHLSRLVIRPYRDKPARRAARREQDCVATSRPRARAPLQHHRARYYSCPFSPSGLVRRHS